MNATWYKNKLGGINDKIHGLKCENSVLKRMVTEQTHNSRAKIGESSAASRELPPRSVLKQIGIVPSTYCKWCWVYEMEGMKGGEGVDLSIL